MSLKYQHKATVIDTEHPHYGKLYSVCCRTSQADKLAELEAALTLFGKLWIDLFGEHAVTCYIHILCCHAVPLLKIHGNLGQFSNSGLESFHKVTKWMLNKTNRWGSTLVSHVALDIMRNYYKLLMLEIEFTENTKIISRFENWQQEEDDEEAEIVWGTCPCEDGGDCVWGEVTGTDILVPHKRKRLALENSVLPSEKKQISNQVSL